jgi:hypothetical protein
MTAPTPLTAAYEELAHDYHSLVLDIASEGYETAHRDTFEDCPSPQCIQYRATLVAARATEEVELRDWMEWLSTDIEFAERAPRRPDGPFRRVAIRDLQRWRRAINDRMAALEKDR